jgi:hypothetical protein
MQVIVYGFSQCATYPTHFRQIVDPGAHDALQAAELPQ